MVKVIYIMCVFLYFNDIACSINLGVYGEVFEIEEEDVLDFIYKKLSQIDQDKLDNLRNVFRYKCPKPVSGVTFLATKRTFTYDPSIVLSRDIYDHNHHVFAKSGDRINPLDTVRLSKQLVFIDGDDERQVNYAIKQIAEWVNIKLILTSGNPFDLEYKLQRLYGHEQSVFFDQNGFLIRKIGITSVPAVVFQKSNEKVLTVVEGLCE